MTDSNANSTPPDAPNDTLWQAIERRPSLLTIVGMSAIFLLTLCAFWTSMNNGFIWDDDFYVTKNPNLRTWEGLGDVWIKPGPQTQYYPLSSTALWIEYQLFGLDARGYHIVNVVLHAISATLLWILLRRLTVPGAWAIAAVFAIHPVQVESVAWVTEIKNVLSGFFYFCSMLVYLRYCGITPSIGLARRAEKSDEQQGEVIFSKEWFALPEDPTRLYALAILLFACALACKSVTATMPAAVLLIVWWKRGKLIADDFLPLIPFFVLGIGMGIFTAYWEHTTIGAAGAAWQLGPNHMQDALVRCIVAGRAVWFYFAKLLAPYPLIFSYPRWNISAGDALQYAFPICAVLALIALWTLRRKIGRGPLAAALFFVGTLVPALGFVNVYPMQYSFVADHFQYIARIGIFALVIGALSFGVKKLVALNALNPAAAPAAVVVLLGALAIRTGQRALAYENVETIWADTIRQTGGGNTTSWLASNNYGIVLLRKGYTDAAERWFNYTLKLKPDHAPALFNLGLIAEARGNSARALEMRVPPLWVLGFHAEADMQLKKSMDFFLKSREADPDYDPTNFKLAEIYARLDRPAEAIAIYSKLAEKYPDMEQVHVNLGVQLANASHFDEAINEFQAAINADPDSLLGHLHLGDVYFSVGRTSDAAREYAEVLRIDKNNTDVRVSIGRLLVVQGYFTQAAGMFQEAIKLNPRLVTAHYYLGRVYSEMQDYPKAIAQFRRVLEMVPAYPDAQKKLDEAIDLQAHPEKRPATTRSSTRPATIPATSRP